MSHNVLPYTLEIPKEHKHYLCHTHSCLYRLFYQYPTNTVLALIFMKFTILRFRLHFVEKKCFSLCFIMHHSIIKKALLLWYNNYRVHSITFIVLGIIIQIPFIVYPQRNLIIALHLVKLKLQKVFIFNP